MALDFKNPIDIEAVNNTSVVYGDVLKPVDQLDVKVLLDNMMLALGVQSSLVLGKKEHGSITKKYNGIFEGDKNLGTIVPRTLVVYPVVAEIADEPERYRRSFITQVNGNMWKKEHPFALWIVQDSLRMVSEELYYAIFPAKRSELAGDKSILDSFDGYFTIIDNDITAGLISAAKNNMYAPGTAITRANAGEYLLEMWRSRHAVLRNANTNLWVSAAVGDLYDDWYRDEHDAPPNVETTGQTFLDGTNKRCQLIRTNAFPVGSQRTILTKRTNMYCGLDELADLKSIRAFIGANPYLFTATMKFVWGTQFESIHEREFCVNDRSGSGSGSTSA
jgi:hypothetical protein